MGPGGRRPSHPSAKNQITPTSGLVSRQANHLLQNLVPLPQSCEGPSECNEATRLGLRCEGTPPQCNGGLFTWRLVDPQSPKDGRQLACPPLTSGGLALEGGHLYGVWGRTQPTVLLLDQFFFMDVEKKNRAKKP